VALEAAQRALEQITESLLEAYDSLLTSREPLPPGRLAELGRSLDAAYAFVSRIELLPGDAAATAQRIAQLHAIDHLLRFRARLENQLRAGPDLTTPDYGWALAHNQQILALARRGLAEQRMADMLPELEVNALGLTELSRQMRHELLGGATTPPGEVADLLSKADAYRWLERTGHHIWRISHYLVMGRPTPGPGAAAA